MPRFNSVATLKNVTLTQDGAGNFTESQTNKTVFVNTFKVGASAWLAAQAAGLHADAEIQLRSLDYEGEERVVLDGVEYEVERVNNQGEFTRLTLAKRLNNA